MRGWRGAARAIMPRWRWQRGLSVGAGARPGTRMLGALLTGLVLGSMPLAQADEIPLYPTGPAEDVAFLRFADARDGDLQVQASGSGATLDLSADQRVSPYQMVPGGTALGGELVSGDQNASIQVQLEPGEFVTVLAVDDEGGQMGTRLLRESPEDFSAVRASLAFHNLNAACAPAQLRVAGRDIQVFKAVEPDQTQRLQVNPVALALALYCAGEAVGDSIDLGKLESGERYSIFLAPGDPARRLFYVKDSVAH